MISPPPPSARLFMVAGPDSWRPVVGSTSGILSNVCGVEDELLLVRLESDGCEAWLLDGDMVFGYTITMLGKIMSEFQRSIRSTTITMKIAQRIVSTVIQGRPFHRSPKLGNFLLSRKHQSSWHRWGRLLLFRRGQETCNGWKIARDLQGIGQSQCEIR